MDNRQVRIKLFSPAGHWNMVYEHYQVLYQVDMNDWFSLIPQNDFRHEAKEIVDEMRDWLVVNIGVEGTWFFDEGHNGRNIIVGFTDEEEAFAFTLRWIGHAEY